MKPPECRQWQAGDRPCNPMISSVTCKNPITEQINSELQMQLNKQGALGSHTAQPCWTMAELGCHGLGDTWPRVSLARAG